MRIIGITGGSGSGKGALCELLQEAGILCLDTDKVYHALTESDTPCVRELRAAFGDEILAANGGLNRSRLAEIVFRNDEGRRSRMALLNQITHHYVKSECQRWLENQLRVGREAVVLDVPLLFESGLDQICDTTVAVLASRCNRIMRVMARDGLTRERAEARIDAQPSDDFYITRADHLYYNDGTMSELREEAERLLRVILY